MKCIYCGSELKENQDYCKHCKSNLKASQTKGIIKTSSMQEFNEGKDDYKTTFIIATVTFAISVILCGLLLWFNISFVLANEIKTVGFLFFISMFPYTMFMFLPFIICSITSIICFIFSIKSCKNDYAITSKILLIISSAILTITIFFSLFASVVV